MKFSTVSKSAVLGLAVLFASSAFAASKANLHLNNPTVVNGTTLKAGDYKLEWDGTGPSVDVSVKQGKNVVAKIPAQLVDLSSASASDATVIVRNDSGPSTLKSIRFEGKKYALDLVSSSGDMQAGSSK